MFYPRSTHLIVFSFILAAFQLNLCGQARGQGAPPPVKGATTANAQPAKEKDQDYSQEAFVIEKLQTPFRFEKDGSGQREVRLGAKVQSGAGVQGFGQLVFPFRR